MPDKVTFEVDQPTAMAVAIDEVSRQVRSKGVFKITIDFAYSLLSFDERDTLESFLIDMGGSFSEFDVYVPTRSENNTVTSTTATAAAAYPINATTLILNGIVGSLKPNDLIRVNGKKSTYVVVQAFTPVSGSQQIRIKPPLRDALALGDTVITKNVTVNVYLEKDSVKVNSKGMTASIKFSMVEATR